jgi:hypothetical protein
MLRNLQLMERGPAPRARRAWALLALTFLIPVLACAQSPQPDRRALLIGISRYEDCAPGKKCLNNLEGPQYDVEAMRKVLQERFGFGASDIQVLLDRQANKPAVVAALRELAAWAKPGRQIFIYFSGHGTSPENEEEKLPLPDQSGALVLAPPAAPRPASMDPSTYLLHEMFLVGRTEVRPVLEQMDRNGAIVVAVLDACFSQNTIRSAAQHERRYRGRGFASAYAPINTSVLKTHEPAAASSPEWPYHHVAYISAASANEPALDLETEDLSRWPTFDGKPHGALTDALLRVLNGQEPYRDADGRGALSYAELFDAAESYMRRRQYHQTPHLSPSELSSDAQALAIMRLPVFGRGLPAPRTPSGRAGLTVSLAGGAVSLREQLARIAGIEVIDHGAEYHIKQGAEAGIAWQVLTGQDESVLTAGSGAPLSQRPDEVLESFRIRAALRRLAAAANARSAGLEIIARSDDPNVGGTLHGGQKLSLVLRASRDVTVALIHVMGDGSTRIWLPSLPGESTCNASSHVSAGSLTRLCSWPGSSPPYGLDLVYILAAEGDSAELAAIKDRELTPAVLAVLENVVAHHPGRVVMLEKSLFTVGG